MLLVTFYVVFVLPVAATAVWLYRKLSDRYGAQEELVGGSRPQTQMTLKAQQGFISFTPAKRKHTQAERPPRRKLGNIKAPWGW